MPAWNLRRLGGLTAILFLSIALWDAVGLDLPFARMFGSSMGFPLRSNHAFVLAFHEIPRTLSSILVLGLLLGIFIPFSFLKRLIKSERSQLAFSVLGAMLLVTLFKSMNTTSCPCDLSEFGGRANYVSHWVFGVRDLGPGHCFPAGHASSAFGFLAGWFVIRRAAPQVSGRWWVLSLLLGLVLGFSQQMRGAHYLSHTLWTAWICWTFGLVVEICVQQYFRAKKASALESNPIQESLQ